MADNGPLIVIGIIIAVVIFMLIMLLSGGCGIEWRTIDGAVALDDEGNVVAKTLAIEEKPGWMWRVLGWGDAVRIWNGIPDEDDKDDWVWMRDSGIGVGPSDSMGSSSNSKVSSMWESWYAQKRTGFQRPAQSDENEIILREAQKLMKEQNNE